MFTNVVASSANQGAIHALFGWHMFSDCIRLYLDAACACRQDDRVQPFVESRSTKVDFAVGIHCK